MKEQYAHLLEFHGTLTIGDEVTPHSWNGYAIGGVDFIEKIADKNFHHVVTVGVNSEIFTGDLEVYEGTECYSDRTHDPARFRVGSRNILTLLDRYEDEVVTLWVAKDFEPQCHA